MGLQLLPVAVVPGRLLAADPSDGARRESSGGCHLSVGLPQAAQHEQGLVLLGRDGDGPAGVPAAGSCGLEAGAGALSDAVALALRERAQDRHAREHPLPGP